MVLYNDKKLKILIFEEKNFIIIGYKLFKIRFLKLLNFVIIR